MTSSHMTPSCRFIIHKFILKGTVHSASPEKFSAVSFWSALISLRDRSKNRRNCWQLMVHNLGSAAGMYKEQSRHTERKKIRELVDHLQ